MNDAHNVYDAEFSVDALHEENADLRQRVAELEAENERLRKRSNLLLISLKAIDEMCRNTLMLMRDM